MNNKIKSFNIFLCILILITISNNMGRPRNSQNEKGKGRASPIVRIAPYTPVFAIAEASNSIDETSASKESNKSGKKHYSWDEIDVESTDNKSSKDRLTDFLLDDSGKYLRDCLSGKNSKTGRRTSSDRNRAVQA